jgi:hypothetical protein
VFARYTPVPPQSLVGLDAEYAQMAREIPGFGGLFYDEAGDLNVILARREGVQGVAQLNQALMTRLQMVGVDVDAQPTRLLEGAYDFAQLAAIHQRAAVVLGLNGVVFIDTDEARNRVAIGVENADAASDVERALGMAGIPNEAVIVELAEPIVPHADHTLRNRQRPVAGGLQINFTRGTASFVCTLGFNVRVPGVAQQFFVTNSHCSDTRGEVVPTPYWQPSGAPDLEHANFIGWEVWDPPFFTGDPCPPGRNCRYADALGAQYETGVPNVLGGIYRTTFPGFRIGSIEVDQANPMWRIVGEVPNPVLGQTVHKTGRTRGWTVGQVIGTCITTNVAGEGEITMLCQNRVRAGSAGGDSGAPIFERVDDGDRIRLHGLNWGGSADTYVFSSMEMIRRELPGPWITH